MKKPNKPICLILAVVMIFSAICVSATAAAIPGDVNGDGNVGSDDARLALRASVKLENYPKGSPAFLACDADGDGDVTSQDARLILRAAVGLEKLGDPGTRADDNPAAYDEEADAVFFGNVISFLGNVYYWKYNSNSYLHEDSTFANYSFNKAATNQLICRKADGTETTVLSTNGAGEICIAGSRLYYQLVVNDYAGMNYRIMSCRLDGTDVKTVGNGVLRGVVDKENYVIIENVDYNSHEIYSIDASSGNKTTLSKDTYLTCSSQYVICYSSNAGSDSNTANRELKTYRLKADGTGRKDLYTNRAKELVSVQEAMRNSYSGSVMGYFTLSDPFISDENILYYCFAHIAGSGNVIQSNQIVKADLNTDEAKTIEGGIAWTENYSSYEIPEGKEYADHLNNLNAPALNRNDYAGFSSLELVGIKDVNDGKLKAEYCESVGNKTYVLLTYGRFTSWNGWRDRYQFSKCALFEKNNDTGAVTMIYSTN